MVPPSSKIHSLKGFNSFFFFSSSSSFSILFGICLFFFLISLTFTQFILILMLFPAQHHWRHRQIEWNVDICLIKMIPHFSSQIILLWTTNRNRMMSNGIKKGIDKVAFSELNIISAYNNIKQLAMECWFCLESQFLLNFERLPARGSFKIDWDRG